MKTMNRDEYDANQSIFTDTSCPSHHPFSKTTPFAEISFRVAEFFGLFAQGSPLTRPTLG
jgi:hypothetical protein